MTVAPARVRHAVSARAGGRRRELEFLQRIRHEPDVDAYGGLRIESPAAGGRVDAIRDDEQRHLQRHSHSHSWAVSKAAAPSNDGYVEIWSLIAPPVGTGTIVVTVPAGDAIVGGAVSFTGVDQTAPLGPFTSTFGQSTAPSATVTERVRRDRVRRADVESRLDARGRGFWSDRTLESHQGESRLLRRDGRGQPPIPGDTSVTLSWTTEDDSWAVGAVAVRSAATVEYTLAEGATGAFFDLDILLANPNDTPVLVNITFLEGDGTTLVQSRTLPPLSRTTILVDEIQGLESAEVSTTVSSANGLPIVVERTMRWDETGYGSHTEKAAHGAERTWYFAEGSQGFFHTFLLLANPAPAPNEATVEFLIENGVTVTKTYPLQPTSRFTVDAATIPELRDRSFGMKVTFTQPGMAERAMYFGDVPLFSGGHESAGVPGASTEWFLAEGATGELLHDVPAVREPEHGRRPRRQRT